MDSIFFYIIIHPIAAFIGWMLCGLVKHEYLRIALRSAVLAIAFTPAVLHQPTGDVPVSAVTALLFGMNVEPRPDTTIVIVWGVIFLIGIVLRLQKRNA